MDTQFKKGVVELLILAIVSQRDCYGYELVSSISRHIELTEGTVYPLLRRLTKEGLFTTYLVESDEGPSRKYYKLTTKGNEHLQGLAKRWSAFSNSVQVILKEAGLG